MESEFDILNRRMEKNLEMRHTYLMFAFTTSIAAIAALFVVGFTDIFTYTNISAWICIVPFAVIIPFQARISYSRLSHAKMEAYMVVFYEGKFVFLEKSFDELYGIMGKIIAVIANYELTLLSIVIDILFVLIKVYISNTSFWGMDNIIIFIATLIVFSLATYSRPYGKFLHKFIINYREISCDH